MAVTISKPEQIEILMMHGYGDRQRSFEEVCSLFNTVDLDRHISKSTMHQTVHKYEALWQVEDLPEIGRPRTATHENTGLNVLLTVQENNRLFATELGQLHGISQECLQNYKAC